MKNFNAAEANKIASTVNNSEIHNILNDIKRSAEKGKTVLHIYRPLMASSIDEIEKRGFKVIRSPSIATQRDGLHYSVNW